MQYYYVVESYFVIFMFSTFHTYSSAHQKLTDGGGQGAADQRNSTGILRPVTEIPEQYRPLFSHFPYFNIVQSTVFQDVFYSDRSVVVSAPTGSGKTVVMELALVRLLLSGQHHHHDGGGGYQPQARVVYMAPLKALVKERYLDWRQRLTTLNLTCAEVTGDTDHDDIAVIRNSQVVLTTPEKWDSLTRRWRDHASLMQAVSLLLIDEVHVLSDEGRGPTLEAVVSRMKTIRATRPTTSSDNHHNTPRLRFVAVSATIPNVEDVAAWLSDEEGPAVSHRLEESLRPVSLRRVVLGYDCRESWTEFRFDISLTYRLPSVIATYSNNKPTLVFVSTRKAAQTTALTLMREARLVRDASHRQLLTSVGNALRDNKLRECVLCGVGYHHAGLDATDRHQVEELFVAGQLPVLVATSTLAMGVNLPAHLVVIKSTAQYVGGAYTEYSTTQLLQMMGRAGRPQFDDHATAVIMTKNQLKVKYENLVSGRNLLESHLHLHLVEHLNAEIVLGTVTDLGVAVEWLRSTFLYVRVQHNPRHYGLPQGLQHPQLEAKLQEMCMREVNALAQVGLIVLSEVDVKATPPGRLMARYCVSFTTMKTFIQLRGDESIKELVETVCACREFWDIKVRMSEKRVLNELNKSQASSIRFPIKGRIKTREHKINCLVQATLGCQNIVDSGLSQEANKIMRTGQRITKCTLALRHFHCTHLAHCTRCEYTCCYNTEPRYACYFLNVQMGIFITNPAITTYILKFDLIQFAHPSVRVESSEVQVTVRLANHLELQKGATTPRHHSSRLIFGDTDNNVVYHQRVTDAALVVCESVTRVVTVNRAQNGDELAVNFISETWAGLDVQSCYSPRYLPRPQPSVQPNTAPTLAPSIHGGGGKAAAGVGGNDGGDGVSRGGGTRRACLHTCGNKLTCAHNCCKVGVSGGHQGSSSSRGVPSVVQEIRKRASQLPATPKMKIGGSDAKKLFSKFRYSPHRPRLLPRPAAPVSQATSLATNDTSQPTANQNIRHPIGTQNIRQSTPNQNIRQPIAHQSLRQPTPQKKTRQPTSNQNIRQPTSNQNIRQPIAYQSFRQTKPNQNIRQSIVNQSLRQPTPNQNIRQTTPNQNIRQPIANQSLRQPTPNQNICQPIGTQNIRQPIANQNIRQPIPSQTLRQPISNQNFRQPIGTQNIRQPNPNQNLRQHNTNQNRQPIANQNVCQATASQNIPQPVVSQNSRHTFANQNICQPIANQNIGQPIANHNIRQPIGIHDNGQAIANQSIRQPNVNQNARQPIANQHAYQPIVNQDKHQLGFNQSTRQTIFNQNIRQSYANQNGLGSDASQGPIRQCSNQAVGAFQSIPHGTYFANQQQTDTLIDEDVLQEFENVSNFDGDEWQDDFPDMETDMTEENYPAVSAAEEENSDAFAEPLGIEDPEPSSSDLSAASWNKFQARQQQSGISCNQQSASNLSTTSNLSKRHVEAPTAPLNIGEPNSESQVQPGQQGVELPGFEQEPHNLTEIHSEAEQWPPWILDGQIHHTQRPLQPAQANQNQMAERQANQIQGSSHAFEAPAGQNKRSIHPSVSQANKVSRPLGYGTRISQSHKPLMSQATQMNKFQRPLRFQGTRVNLNQRPLGPYVGQMNQIRMPLGAQETQVNQIQMPLRAQGTQVNQIQTPLSAQGTQENQIQMPLRAQETQLNQIQMPLRSHGTQVNQIQMPLGRSGPPVSQLQRLLRPVAGQANQIQRPIRTTGQVGQNETPLKPPSGQTYWGEIHPFGAEDLEIQNAALPLHSQINQMLPPAFNHESQPTSRLFGDQFQVSSDGSGSENQWIEQPESQVSQTTFEQEEEVACGGDNNTHYTPVWYAQSTSGSNVMQQEPFPSQVGLAAPGYQNLAGNQVASAQNNRLRYLQVNPGCMNFSDETVHQDWNAGQGRDHVNLSNGLPLQSTSQQPFAGVSWVPQHSKPVAGIKPLPSTSGQSSGNKQKVKDDPFSHLTKEWVESQRGRNRSRVSNIVPTSQGARSTVEAPKASTGTQHLDDDWRDLEMFQWCRQQERLVLDSLYQKGQAQTAPPSTHLARPAGTQGDETINPGSLHITYTSGNRGPALGLGLTNMGSLQQNININLSSMLDSARNTHKVPGEPQVRGILKKSSQR
ncbi:uncharacterized protein [Panulirus ornatus]|uniref:uncharacterized protein n=1 Tax=Panulirus ornatus TaxID=150431 RepID=UPI003A84A1CF